MWTARIFNTDHGPRVGMFCAGELTASYPAGDYHLFKCEAAARWLNHVNRLGARTAYEAA